MSYARFDENSDVYIFWDGCNMVCCGCTLDDDKIGSRFLSICKMIDHIKEHIDYGDKVEDDVIPSIIQDMKDGKIVEVEEDES